MVTLPCGNTSGANAMPPGVMRPVASPLNSPSALAVAA